MDPTGNEVNRVGSLEDFPEDGDVVDPNETFPGAQKTRQAGDESVDTVGAPSSGLDVDAGEDVGDNDDEGGGTDLQQASSTMIPDSPPPGYTTNDENVHQHAPAHPRSLDDPNVAPFHDVDETPGGWNGQESEDLADQGDALSAHPPVPSFLAASSEEDDYNNQRADVALLEHKQIAPTAAGDTPPIGRHMDATEQTLKRIVRPVEQPNTDGQQEGMEGNVDEQNQSGPEEESEDEVNAQPLPVEGSYDSADYANLPVSTEVKELFQFIDAYAPQTVEIDAQLRPFILDYIPAVGDIDAFIKIPRPDGVDDNLGLVVLDEPCAKQSDPTILNLQLRTISKAPPPPPTVTADGTVAAGGQAETAVAAAEQARDREVIVKKLGRADKNAKEVEQWITSLTELHKSKPPTTVHYQRPMPDIDTLMQEWPPEFEEMLKKTELPTADMDMPLESYVDLICTLLDIPVNKSRVHALHVLFTLYSEFKNSQHFRALADENRLDNDDQRPPPNLIVMFTLYSEFKNSQHFRALADENRLDNDDQRPPNVGQQLGDANADQLIL